MKRQNDIKVQNDVIEKIKKIQKEQNDDIYVNIVNKYKEE